MSNGYSWDDENDEDGTPTLKDLRNQIKALSKKLSEKDEEIATLRPKVKGFEVGNILKELGYKQTLSKFVTRDVEDITPESVKAWLEENGDLFANAKIDTAPPVQDTDKGAASNSGTEWDPDTVDAVKRVQSQGEGTPALAQEQGEREESALRAIFDASTSLEDYLQKLREAPKP